MAYEVATPVYDGPFDLLLHLILKEEVDIHEVSLTRIVEAYLEEIQRMQMLDLDIATEFLLIASTLVELKTRRLLPGREDMDLDEELALWQEYFTAHQQNSIRGGLSGVSPIARVEADRPMLDNTETIIVNNSGAGEWMNVWEPSPYSTDPSVEFNYVSSSR